MQALNRVSVRLTLPGCFPSSRSVRGLRLGARLSQAVRVHLTVSGSVPRYFLRSPPPRSSGLGLSDEFLRSVLGSRLSWGGRCLGSVPGLCTCALSETPYLSSLCPPPPPNLYLCTRVTYLGSVPRPVPVFFLPAPQPSSPHLGDVLGLRT
ncbi:hypothetical protein NDU88_004580 [Pleurodeles waltl]|uniref:Uncharacterized protein n=1 Tax=Pleurodeles waltl TaxID=8319 RepID=A0AAV7KYT4_PLEWA|nr:hypothetical protein NDU88_004580 [Pleurodeles waltl]